MAKGMPKYDEIEPNNGFSRLMYMLQAIGYLYEALVSKWHEFELAPDFSFSRVDAKKGLFDTSFQIVRHILGKFKAPHDRPTLDGLDLAIPDADCTILEINAMRIMDLGKRWELNNSRSLFLVDNFSF